MLRVAAVGGLVVVGLLFAGPGRAQELGAARAHVLGTICATCHADPETGAPLMGLPGDWEQARERGFARVLQNTVDGYANMPPLGTCGSCTEDDFRALIRAMTGIEP